MGRSFFKEGKPLAHPKNELRKLCWINQVNAGFFIALFAGSKGRSEPGARMSRTGQSEQLRLRPQAMSLDEARQVITRWLESIETVDPTDLTEERFECSWVWRFARALLARSYKSRSKCWFGFPCHWEIDIGSRCVCDVRLFPQEALD